MDAKLALKVNEHNIGFLPSKGSLPSASKVNVNTKPDLNEAFFVRRERTPDDPDVIAGTRFRGLNQWPRDLPGFRETVLAYMGEMERFAKRMVPVYATALGLPHDWFDRFFGEPNMVLRMSRYTPPAKFRDNEYSLNPHTDSGFMTLLAPSEVPGLSIRLPDGAWFDAPSIPGAFVVNGGDLLRRWTNDRFLATPHRVINASERYRYAIPFFFDTHPDTLIECLPSCCGESDPPHYPPITFHQYAVWFASRTYGHLAAIADDLPASLAPEVSAPHPQPQPAL
jgi:isopenicillin N synthase-like dioxygenase